MKIQLFCVLVHCVHACTGPHLGPTATPRETIEKASKIMVSQPAAQGSLRAPRAPWMQGKRRLPDKQVYPVTAFFRLPERLGGPPETVEKAWKSMYFPAWRPGATRGLRKTWENLINTNVALLHLVPLICFSTWRNALQNPL